MSRIKKWLKANDERDKLYWRNSLCKPLWLPTLGLWFICFILSVITSERIFISLGTFYFVVGISVLLSDMFWVKKTKKADFDKIKLEGSL
jgi:hypothetical protein